MRTVALVVLALALLATYLTWTASRLDRLHARTDAARNALDAQLVRRAAVAIELAAELRDDELTQLARDAQHVRPGDWRERAAAEDALSHRLGSLAAQAAHLPAAAAAAEAWSRAALARRFYNDAVRDTIAFRRRRVVRALRLAGHAPVPVALELDDTPPTPDIVVTPETVA